VCYLCWTVERLTRSADSLDPGPDGQLISSDERLRLARGVHGEVTKQGYNKHWPINSTI